MAVCYTINNLYSSGKSDSSCGKNEDDENGQHTSFFYASPRFACKWCATYQSPSNVLCQGVFDNNFIQKKQETIREKLQSHYVALLQWYRLRHW